MWRIATLFSAVCSLGVFISVFIGACYLIIEAIQWAGKLKASVQVQEVASKNQQACARCGRQLSLLAVGRGRRLQCARCQLNVCRHCCYHTSSKKWLCTACKKHREIKLQSGEWFNQQLHQRFCSKVAALSHTDTNDEEVREFMEKLVETLVDGKLDSVPLFPLTTHEKYVTFFTIYHEILADTLTRLSFSLKMAVSDKSLPEEEPPSVVHLELQELITQIIQKAEELPSFKDAQYGLRDNDTTIDLDTKNYEDILATAILNKVVSRYQKKIKKKTEDKNFSIVGSKIEKKHTMNSLGNLDGNIESVSESSTESVDEYNSWSESSHHEPLSLKIEECIEEVTTRYNSDDEHEVATSEIDRFLSSMKFIKRQKVPFPEFGMDIVDGQQIPSDSEGGDDEEEDEEVNISVGVELVNPVDSWEENWLFQRKKLKTAVGTCQPVPVPMLVPNPSQDYRALIGDVDADETSDLSECSDSVLEDLIDGTDLNSYGKNSSHKDVKDKEVLQKQRELFLEYVREDLNYSSIESQNKLNCNTISSTRGISSDSEQELAMEYIEMNYQNGTKNNDVTQTLDQQQTNTQHLKINNVNTSLDTDHFYLPNSIINEAINPNIPIVQASSGEESLEIQKDSEYTVHYAAIAQLEPTAGSASPIPTPKPRTIHVNSVVNQNNPFSIKEVADPIDLEKPPLPGSIAEREHKKWLHAPPILNNPYSKENIERRQKKLMYTNKRSSSETSIEFPEVQKEPSLTEIGEKSVMKDYTPYVRDYYVNVNTGKEEGIQIENKIKLKSKEVSTLQLEEHVEQQRMQQVSVKIEVEVARWPSEVPKLKPSVQTQTTTIKNNDPLNNNDMHIALPSVKELAKQFSKLDELEKVPRPFSPHSDKPKLQEKLHCPVREVHSLTARSISREFRDGLRSGITESKIITKDKDFENLDQISDDSGTVSPTPAPTVHHASRVHDEILFWEKKNVDNT